MLGEGNEGNGPEDDVKGEANIWSEGDPFRETKGAREATGEDGVVSEPRAMSARLDNALILS